MKRWTIVLSDNEAKTSKKYEVDALVLITSESTDTGSITNGEIYSDESYEQLMNLWALSSKTESKLVSKIQDTYIPKPDPIEEYIAEAVAEQVQKELDEEKYFNGSTDCPICGAQYGSCYHSNSDIDPFKAEPEFEDCKQEALAMETPPEEDEDENVGIGQPAWTRRRDINN